MLLTAWLLLVTGAATGTDPRWPPPERPMRLTADHLLYTPATGILTADGHAMVKTPKLTLRGDHVSYDANTGEAIAKGNASITSGPTAALAETVHVNVRTLESNVENAFFLQKKDIDPEKLSAMETPEQLRKAGKNLLALKGEKLHRKTGNALDVDGLNFTPCDCDPLNPSWHIQSTHGYVVVGEHAFLLWPVIYVGPVPILAFPVLDMPLADRRSGLLIPKPAYDPRRGFSLELPYFFTLGPSYDITVTPGYFFGGQYADGSPVISRSVAGPRLVGEFRYAPSKTVTGDLRLGLLYDRLGIRDPDDADCILQDELKQGVTAPHPAGCAARSGTRGIRMEASYNHYSELGNHWFAKADLTLVSDGYYLGDVATDLFTTGIPYTQSTASVYRRDDNTYVGLDMAYRQDLRYGYQLIGPVDRTAAAGQAMDPNTHQALGPVIPAGTALYGPNTLQRLPALTVSAPDSPLIGKLMGGVKASYVRIAPLSGLTGDEGSDGIFSCPGGQGALNCLLANPGQGDRKWEPGEREARDRIDIRPRLSYPLIFGNIVHVTPSIWWREDVYKGEVTGIDRARGYGEGSVEAEAVMEGTFGKGPTALHHSITPVAEVRYVPRVWGSTLGSYDDIDSAIPQPTRPGQPGLAQAMVEVRQRLYTKNHEWARLDLGQGFDMLDPRVADSYARVAMELGPFKVSGIARYDPVRTVFSQVSAQARYSRKDGEVYVQYDSFATNGSDWVRRGIDALVGPATTGSTLSAQQIVAGARYALKFGVGLAYEAVVLPLAYPSTLRLAQQRIGVTLAPACNCWSLEGGVRLIPSPVNGTPQFNFEANLTIAHFGSIGTGG